MAQKKKKTARKKRPDPALGHQQLAALDLIILNAMQRGAKPDEVLTFLDDIGNALVDAAGFAVPVDDVGNDVQDALDAVAAVLEITELFGNRSPGAAEALAKVARATLSAPPRVSLRQLIELRRKAVNAKRG
jgi:hypothetical protein